MVPSSGRSAPTRQRSSVDLPAPLRPVSAIASPARTSRLNLSKIVFGPKARRRPDTLSTVARLATREVCLSGGADQSSSPPAANSWLDQSTRRSVEPSRGSHRTTETPWRRPPQMLSLKPQEDRRAHRRGRLPAQPRGLRRHHRQQLRSRLQRRGAVLERHVQPGHDPVDVSPRPRRPTPARRSVRAAPRSRPPARARSTACRRTRSPPPRATTRPVSTLVTAVKTAGLVDTLNNADDITVFAPTNDAFKKIPAATLKKVLADKKTLTAILTGHVTSPELTPTDLSGDHTSLAKTTIKVTGSGEDFTVDGQLQGRLRRRADRQRDGLHHRHRPAAEVLIAPDRYVHAHEPPRGALGAGRQPPGPRGARRRGTPAATPRRPSWPTCMARRRAGPRGRVRPALRRAPRRGSTASSGACSARPTTRRR